MPHHAHHHCVHHHPHYHHPPHYCMHLSCTCNTSYVRILMLFNIFLHPSRSPASSCHSGTASSSLSHGFTRRPVVVLACRMHTTTRPRLCTHTLHSPHPTH
jgi:hypothetical protein